MLVFQWQRSKLAVVTGFLSASSARTCDDCLLYSSCAVLRVDLPDTPSDRYRRLDLSAFAAWRLASRYLSTGGVGRGFFALIFY